MKKSKLTFTGMYLMAALIPLILLALITGVDSVTTITEEMEESTYEKLAIAASDLATFYEKELSVMGEISYDTTMVDSQQSQDIELTLFVDDTRFVTSLKNEDGTRNEGTQADSTIYATVKGGSDFQNHNVTIGNSNYYVYYTPIYDTDGNFYGMAFAGTPEDEINETIATARNKFILVTILVVIVCTVVITLLVRKIKRNIDDTINALQNLSDGDVSTQISAESRIKEFQDIIDATVNLQQKLDESIGGVKNTCTDLDQSVENVDELSENSANGAEEIKEAVNELAITAQSMAETVQDANANVISMGDNITEIANKVKVMSADSAKMQELNDTTMVYMNQVQDSTSKAVSAIESIGKQTRDTNDAVEKIKSAAEIIAEIASQTNLLSLNASIEAARAGEAGKGFAVVADNIKGLAEQSAASANSIQQVVNEIVALSEESVNLSADTVTIIKDQQDIINQTVEKINELSSSVNTIADNVDSIDRDTENLNESKESVLANISDLSAISEENAASAEEVTANVESIANGIEGTKDQSKEMRTMAEILVDKMKFFH